MRRFFAAGLLMIAATLAAATAASAALPSTSYQLGGIGFGSTFFGTGIGSSGDRGSWQASLSTAGGAVSGTLTFRSGQTQEAGTISSGQSAVAGAARGCGMQQLTINAAVDTADGPMTLTGTVTQFRFQFRGACTVLASTMQGTLAQAAPTDSGGGGGGQL